jgi:hypothetical protein
LTMDLRSRPRSRHQQPDRSLNGHDRTRDTRRERIRPASPLRAFRSAARSACERRDGSGLLSGACLAGDIRRALLHRQGGAARDIVLTADMLLEREGRVMAWNSESTWVLIYSVLITLLVLAWAYVPA